ncbi:MAG: NUDIX hydrolase [Oscillospiraceae bacterium]
MLLVRHNYGSAKGKYLNPGGYFREGELPEDAAIREVFEETGVKIKPIGMIAIRCQNGEWYMVLKAEYIKGEPRANLSENEDVVFMNISDTLNHPCVTDTAKTLIQVSLTNKSMPAKDCRKNRKLYSVDNII